MKIIIAAGTGFLGKNLEQYFTEKGHQVYILTRSPKRRNEFHWNARTLGEWKNLLKLPMFSSISLESP
uniref:NAD-dependent epimerase/dehydratase family protein n=1 Tax=Chryseobacterium endophyticum TaxID=1854762 RepID=A0AAU6WMN0_9FLAO